MSVITAVAVNDIHKRAQLSGAAVRAFFGIARLWGLSSSEQVDLLGASLSRNTLKNWEDDQARTTLSADQLMRISYLLAIYEGLQRIWRRAPIEADRWVRRSRSEAPFSGSTPLDFLLKHGIPAFVATRAYIDGATGGPPSRAGYQQPPHEPGTSVAAAPQAEMGR